jgi:hypothetical protein
MEGPTATLSGSKSATTVVPVGSETQQNPASRLDVHTVECLMRSLPAADIVRAGRVCRRWHAASISEALYRALCIDRLKLEKSSALTWRQTFISSLPAYRAWHIARARAALTALTSNVNLAALAVADDDANAAALDGLWMDIGLLRGQLDTFIALPRASEHHLLLLKRVSIMRCTKKEKVFAFDVGDAYNPLVVHRVVTPSIMFLEAHPLLLGRGVLADERTHSMLQQWQMRNRSSLPGLPQEGETLYMLAFNLFPSSVVVERNVRLLQSLISLEGIRASLFLRMLFLVTTRHDTAGYLPKFSDDTPSDASDEEEWETYSSSSN